MLRFIVAYASLEGQTDKIAHHVAHQIERRGHVARLLDVRGPENTTEAGDFDAAIVAGSVHMGAHDAALEAFVTRHLNAIRQVPSALLSVSLAAASSDADDRHGAEECAETFQEKTGWAPDWTKLVAGAVDDRKYGFIKRFFIHALLNRKGVALEPSGYTEFTDWPALDSFVRDFVTEALARQAPAGQRAV
ncbi:MAG: flavodoxin domain-containing protein [Methyloligellaceae bacterium]